MEFSDYFPIWDQLEPKHQEKLKAYSSHRRVKKGTIIHSGEMNCIGVLLIHSGQLRAYSISGEGREVTLYRLFERDICIFSASCVMPNIMFDVLIEAVQDSELVVLPSPVLSTVMHGNPLVELSLYKRVVENFSDVMWTMQQILFMGADKRVAHFLWDEMAKTGDTTIRLTHEEVARFIGSAREVVTKVLKYFVEEGAVVLSRGKIQIIDKTKLRQYL